MIQNKKQLTNEVCFKETTVKKTLPEKCTKGKKNLSKIFITEKEFQHLSSKKNWVK